MSWHSEEIFLSICPSVVLGGQLENYGGKSYVVSPGSHGILEHPLLGKSTVEVNFQEPSVW